MLSMKNIQWKDINPENQPDETDKLILHYFQNHPQAVSDETIHTIDHTVLQKKHSVFHQMSKIAAVVVLCFSFTTGIIFSKDITTFFGDLFSLKSVNIDNSEIFDNLSKQQYIQNVDMDYIPLNENYSIKVDYLMLDDMNLYLVFNLKSTDKMRQNERISIPNLVIKDQKGYELYNGNDYSFINTTYGWNKINSQHQHIKRELLYILSPTEYSMKNIQNLSIDFSNVSLYAENDKNIKEKEIANHETNFEISIQEQYVNKNSFSYTPCNTDNPDFSIEKCILTNNQLYISYKTANSTILFEPKMKYSLNSRRLLYTDKDKNTRSYYYLDSYTLEPKDDNAPNYLKLYEQTSHATILLKRE